MTPLPTDTLYALGAALLFGASTPAAKWLAEWGLPPSPFMLAGLLYLGSGLGLAVARLLRDRSWRGSGADGDRRRPAPERAAQPPAHPCRAGSQPRAPARQSPPTHP